MHEPSTNWSHEVIEDSDGSHRVEVLDEDGERYPVGRHLTRGQAEQLAVRIGEESRTSRRPVKAVIRDPNFMAATVITVKRLPI